MYDFKENINRMLDETKEVITDPATAKNEEIKARWAYGVLGLDPDNLTKEELSKFFRQQAKKAHPDATPDESTSRAFKYLNYAKDYLKDKITW